MEVEQMGHRLTPHVVRIQKCFRGFRDRKRLLIRSLIHSQIHSVVQRELEISQQ